MCLCCVRKSKEAVLTQRGDYFPVRLSVTRATSLAWVTTLGATPLRAWSQEDALKDGRSRCGHSLLWGSLVRRPVGHSKDQTGMSQSGGMLKWTNWYHWGFGFGSVCVCVQREKRRKKRNQKEQERSESMLRLCVFTMAEDWGRRGQLVKS